MTENIPSKSNKKRSHAGEGRPHNIPDGHKNKQYPNGISATVRAIFENWHEKVTGQPGPLTPDRFIESSEFVHVWKNVLELYPGVPRPQEKVPAKMLRGVDHGTATLTFHILRAISQYVGLETGLFLLFTQFVSQERHALADEEDPRAVSLRFIEKIKLMIEVVEKEIKNRESNSLIFTKNLSDNNYSVDIDILKIWVDAYENKAC